MPMPADVVDGVVGVDTHRDAHQAEIAAANCARIARISIENTETGYVELLAWINQHTPGERLVVSIEGTRSYGAGLARPSAGRG